MPKIADVEEKWIEWETKENTERSQDWQTIPKICMNQIKPITINL